MTNKTRLDELKAYIQAQGWKWGTGKDISHGEQIVVSDAGGTTLVNFWPKRGKMVVQGGDSPLKSALQAWISGEDEPSPKEESMFDARPHIGMDESGKGDWFGPLVVAAVYVDEQSAVTLRQIGVRDSKSLSANEIQRLAGEIERRIPSNCRHVWAIDLEPYNQMYDQHKNINLLLADAYAQVAQKVWQSTKAQSIVCDQFSQKAERLENAFTKSGLPHPVQQHHAESVSIAVAAASILASAAFADVLKELGEQAALEGPLPKGSSDKEKLEAAIHTIIQIQGIEVLSRYAKLHFKPIQKLLAGLDRVTPDSQPTTAPAVTSLTIEQPPWTLEHHAAGGFWRFRFADGGILDWYADKNGKLDVRGKAESASYQKLMSIAHGKTITPGRTSEENERKRKGLVERLWTLFPPPEMACLYGIGWELKETVLGHRFHFTDGAVLQYYQGTKRLLIQGKAQEETQAVLETLRSRAWARIDELADTLKLLFPDWRIGKQDDDQQEDDGPWKPLDDDAWREFWPAQYKKRQAANERSPSQRQLLDDWGSILMHHRGKRHLLAHAPTGLGKTISALVPALAWVAKVPNKRRIYYLVNRVAQHDNPLAELKAQLATIFEQQTGQPLRVVDLVGRSTLCVHPQSRTLTDFCRQSRQQASFDLLPSLVASWREVKAHLGNGACPYHTLQGLMNQAHVVICDYWWLFSQRVQESKLWKQIGLSSGQSVVIVDEAHNLPARVRSQLDIDESVVDIEQAISRTPVEVQKCLNPVIAAAQRTNPQRGISPSYLLAQIGGERVAGDALQLLLSPDQSEEGDADLPERMLRFLLQRDEDVVIYPSSNQAGQQTLIFRLVDPKTVLQKGYGNVHATLSMSGTLTAPADGNEELRYQIPLFGLSLSRTLARTYASPFPLRHQRWIYCTDTYGTYRKRSQHIARYADHIVQIGSQTPGVTAVFFSSYKFLEQVRKAITDPAETKLIVAEQRAHQSKELANYEQALCQLVDQNGRAYLFAVYQGKLAEGANFRGNLIRSVICVSIPLEYPQLFHERLRSLYSQRFVELAEALGDNPNQKAYEYAVERFSLSLILQACGRGIRSEDDRCAFILLDRRYDDYGWRRFLLPRPFNLRQPAETVKGFHQNVSPAIQSGWDEALLAFCKESAE